MTQEAADLLGVDRTTILSWISRDRIPYVKLPSGARLAMYRLSRLGLLSMLGGDRALAQEFRVMAAEAAERESSKRRSPPHRRRPG